MSEHFGYEDAARVRDRLVLTIEKDQDGTVEDMVITGSGLGGFVRDEMSAHPLRLSMKSLLAGIGISDEDNERRSVEGHARELVIGTLKGDEDGPLVLVQNGREHPYEGVDMRRSTFWLRVAQLLGVKTLTGSNASGVVTPDTLKSPTLMLVNSDRDVVGDNPLSGENDARLGPRFPHMMDAYSADTRRVFQNVARRLGISLPEGIYFRVMGPNYERPEDIYALRALARQIWEESGMQTGESRFKNFPTAVVGMSSTYEMMVAMHASQSKFHPAFQEGRAFVSAAANYAASLGPKGLVSPTTHDEVVRETESVRAQCGRLVREAILEMRRKRTTMTS